MIGGGVLGRVRCSKCRHCAKLCFQGCIQEEIRFVINPELLISLLFTAQMGDREAVAIVGAERCVRSHRWIVIGRIILDHNPGSLY